MNPFEIQDRYKKIFSDLRFTNEPDNLIHPRIFYFLLNHRPSGSKIRATYNNDTGILELNFVSIENGLSGTCGLLVTYFFVKIFVTMSAYMKLYDNLNIKP
jgi:hypothetical protein